MQVKFWCPAQHALPCTTREQFAMDFGGQQAGADAGGMELEQLQSSLNAVVVQLFQNQVRKTCFDKCFGTNFPDRMGKTDHICLAKCMDRMFEAHQIVMKASVETA